MTALPCSSQRFRVRDTGSGHTKGMPALSIARQRGSSSELGAVITGTPLRGHAIAYGPERPHTNPNPPTGT
eukprot:355489-Chlamydomonas_euryale.AAC.16